MQVLTAFNWGAAAVKVLQLCVCLLTHKLFLHILLAWMLLKKKYGDFSLSLSTCICVVDMIEHLCSTDLPSMPSWRCPVCAGTQEATSTYTFNCLQWHWLGWVVVINSLIRQASRWLDFLETSWSNIAEVVIGIVHLLGSWHCRYGGVIYKCRCNSSGFVWLNFHEECDGQTWLPQN